MAYGISSAASFADLVTFIRNTCTANGWTLSGNVLHKGNVYVEVIDDAGAAVRIQGGTGIDGSNNLTGGPGEYAYMRSITGVTIAFPLTVEVHINTNPDEVYVVINFATTFYEIMAWGQSDAVGLTGTGVWFHATSTWKTGQDDYCCYADGEYYSAINFGYHCDGTPMFFIRAGNSGSNNSGVNNSFIHHDVDGQGWSAGSGTFPSAWRYVHPLQAYQFNAWNLESILLPFPVYYPRTSGSKVTLVADFKHIRLLRNDYLEPGDIITLGPDKWKVYPWLRKDAVNRNAGTRISHSGTFAYAVRYTGP